RRRHTRFSRDWSSDVCSSDLWLVTRIRLRLSRQPYTAGAIQGVDQNLSRTIATVAARPVSTPARFQRKLLPPGSPNSFTARVAEIGRASCRERAWLAARAGAQ